MVYHRNLTNFGEISVSFTENLGTEIVDKNLYQYTNGGPKTEIPQVYDVTPFLDDHPGGDEVLLLISNWMKDFYVGEVDTNFMPRENKYKSPSAVTYSSYRASGSSSSTKMLLLPFIMPIPILLLAYALYYFA
uniref:cytochrome B5-like n=1 Tax=Erigeron canadensis TaxID=72917 RepID=UPI001CB90675|nr:cytochrome B5-like [Erigeron canadensis]